MADVSDIIAQLKPPKFDIQDPVEREQQMLQLQQGRMTLKNMANKQATDDRVKAIFQKNQKPGPDGQMVQDEVGTFAELLKEKPDLALQYKAHTDAAAKSKQETDYSNWKQSSEKRRAAVQLLATVNSTDDLNAAIPEAEKIAPGSTKSWPRVYDPVAGPKWKQNQLMAGLTLEQQQQATAQQRGYDIREAEEKRREAADAARVGGKTYADPATIPAGTPVEGNAGLEWDGRGGKRKIEGGIADVRDRALAAKSHTSANDAALNEQIDDTLRTIAKLQQPGATDGITGPWALQISKHLGGTEASGAAANLDTLKSQIALKMIPALKTAGVNRITEKEIDLVKKAVTSLDTSVKADLDENIEFLRKKLQQAREGNEEGSAAAGASGSQSQRPLSGQKFTYGRIESLAKKVGVSVSEMAQKLRDGGADLP